MFGVRRDETSPLLSSEQVVHQEMFSNRVLPEPLSEWSCYPTKQGVSVFCALSTHLYLQMLSRAGTWRDLEVPFG